MTHGSNMLKVLIVDDEEEIRVSLSEIVAEEGYEALTAANASDALAVVSGVDLVIADIKLGNDDGLALLQSIKADWPAMPMVMITGFGTVAMATQAFRLGAYDFLEKPLRLVLVRTCLRNALESVRLRRSLAAQVVGGESAIVYRSESMRQLYKQAAKLTNVKQSVMIFGPTGSGKELLARYLHFEGSRASGPFLATNAASLPVTLAEDELFGHEKGAFTGADRKREGVLEQAHGGTLFLDEIGDLDPTIQAKLLRVLEHGEFCRLGGNVPVKVDVRLVCATHKEISAMALAGSFRQDLWYRISAFILRVPPLSDRLEDIPVLATHFLNQVSRELGIKKEFSAQALEALQRQSFPGNVRELRHVVARLAVYVESDSIESKDIVSEPTSTESLSSASALLSMNDYIAMDFRDARQTFEINYLKAILQQQDGNITATARVIGMAQSNLSRKLKELGIRHG